MAKLGVWLIIFGAGSAILQMIGYEFKLLMWVDNWGPTVGWAIRGGLVAVGGALMWFGSRKAKPAPTQETVST